MSVYEDRLREISQDTVVTAAVWDPRQHPRAKDGKFIKVGGWVRGLFKIGSGELLKLNGRVVRVERNDRYPSDPLVRVATKHGEVTAPASQISEAAEPKGTLEKLVSKVLPWVDEDPVATAYKQKSLEGDVAFEPGMSLEGREINGIALTEIVDFDARSVPDVDVGEPPLPETRKAQSAGVLIQEPDGRVWVYEPLNHFGGYSTTFSKGRVDAGDTVQQAALRELYEEMGLTAEITGYVGDYEGSVTNTRMYVGRRTGGAPWVHDAEVAEVRLVSPESAVELLHTERDMQILADLTGDPKALAELAELKRKAAEVQAKRDAEAAARAAKREAEMPLWKKPAPKSEALSLTEKYMQRTRPAKPKVEISYRSGGDGQGDAVTGQYDGWIQADVNGVAAATLDYTIANDEPDVLHIKMIEVLPQFQGHGLGKALLDKVIADQWTDWDYDPPLIEPGMLTDDGMKWWKTVVDDPKYDTAGSGESLSEAMSDPAMVLNSPPTRTVLAPGATFTIRKPGASLHSPTGELLTTLAPGETVTDTGYELIDGRVQATFRTEAGVEGIFRPEFHASPDRSFLDDGVDVSPTGRTVITPPYSTSGGPSLTPEMARERIAAIATSNERADQYVDRLIEQERAKADRLRALDTDALLAESGPLANLIWKQRRGLGVSEWERDSAEVISDDPAAVARVRTRLRRRFRKIERLNGDPPPWFVEAVNESVDVARRNPKIAALEAVVGVPTLEAQVQIGDNPDRTPTANYSDSDRTITYFNSGINGAWAGDEDSEDHRTTEDTALNTYSNGPAVYRHEFGHHVQNVLAGDHTPPGQYDHRFAAFQEAWNAYRAADEAESAAINAATPGVDGYEARVALGKTKVSYYSFQNWREGWAETFRLITDPNWTGDTSPYSPETQELIRIATEIVENPTP